MNLAAVTAYSVECIFEVICRLFVDIDLNFYDET
jgi:hypothetical protein